MYEDQYFLYIIVTVRSKICGQNLNYNYEFYVTNRRKKYLQNININN
jgi:hypothetical protein